MFGRETRMLLRHYLELGKQERTGAPIGRQPRHDSGRAISIAFSMTRRSGTDRGRRCRPSSMPTSRLLKRAWRRIRSCPRCGCSTRSARPAMTIATLDAQGNPGFNLARFKYDDGKDYAIYSNAALAAMVATGAKPATGTYHLVDTSTRMFTNKTTRGKSQAQTLVSCRQMERR